MHQLGYINHFDVWAPLVKQKKKKKMGLEHICALESLLKHIENIPFLNQILTSDMEEIDHGAIEMNHHQLQPRLIFIQRR